MPEALTGTVTFLFTDIEGSVQLWERDAAGAAAAMVRHDAIVEGVVERYGGQVVHPRGEGDSRFAVFARADAAVAAVCDMQRALLAEPWPTVKPVRVRAGLHTGECQVRAGDYYGSTVNRCARLRSLAHGGQVVLSEVIVALVRDALPDGVTLRDLGEHQLRGFQRPDRVFQLLHPDLPADFPPLASTSPAPHNLPVQSTALLGRDREVAAVRALLARPDVRLVVLTGPGGIGKTRIGLQVASDAAGQFADGVVLVQLAAVSDATLVASEIAQAVGVREVGGQVLADRLQEHLREKQLLLLLDNCEQVTGAAPTLASLLAGCPGVKVLATSQHVLHISGEHDFPVPALSLPPDAAALMGVDALLDYGAVRLFVERARAARPDFVLDETNAAAVLGICRRLDGLPLAIELAAARVRLLSPSAMLARIEQGLQILAGGSQDAPARHQTLRAAIGWSYDLLSDSERTLFRRLAVFVGGCTFEAVETVCAPPEIGGADEGSEGFTVGWEPDPFETLAALVERSLLRVEDQADGEPRFTMLATLRAFGLERLAEAGELDSLQQAHAAYYVALAEAYEPRLTGAQEATWLDRLELEHDNLRAAGDWATGRPESDLDVRLGAALWRFWYARGHLSEGRERLQRILVGRTFEAPTMVQARAFNGLGNLRFTQGAYPAAREAYSASLSLATRLGERKGVADALNNLGNLAYRQGDYAAARALHGESLSIRRQLGDRRGVADSLNNLGNLAYRQGALAEARILQEEGLTIRRQLGGRRGIADSLNNLGGIAMAEGDFDAACTLYEESLAIERELGDRRGIAISLNNLGGIAERQGATALAESLYAESLAIKRQLGDRRSIAVSLHSLGHLACERGDLAAARALHEEGLALRRELEDSWGVADSLHGLAQVAIRQGDITAARQLLGQALLPRRDLGSPRTIAESLEALAELAVGQGDYARGAWLFGAAEGQRGESGDVATPTAREGPGLGAARQLAPFAAEREEGRAATLDEAVAYALEGTDL